MAELRLAGLHHPLIAPIDLQLDAGERVFIAGPSGSGKSLLLRAIADLDPHEGEVWLGTEPRSAIPAPAWRRRVGLLPAESHWWGETVGEHFEADAAAQRWLGELGLPQEALQWSVGRLSSGERQRLALVRLLAQSPEALLLDEATANLDPVNRDRVESVVEHYRTAARAAILWVSHDPEQRKRLADRRYMIQNGRLETES